MDDWIAVGLTAGFLTTVGFIPQLIKGVRTKRMGDVSLFMPVLLSFGMLLWAIYGVILDNMPIIFWNAVSLALNLAVISLILRYKGNQCELPT